MADSPSMVEVQRKSRRVIFPFRRSSSNSGINGCGYFFRSPVLMYGNFLSFFAMMRRPPYCSLFRIVIELIILGAPVAHGRWETAGFFFVMAEFCSQTTGTLAHCLDHCKRLSGGCRADENRGPNCIICAFKTPAGRDFTAPPSFFPTAFAGAGSPLAYAVSEHLWRVSP